MKIMHLAILAFFVVGSSTIFTVRNFTEKISGKNVLLKIESNNEVNSGLQANPVLTGSNVFPILSAQSVVAKDLDSKVVLYEKNPQGTLYPASTTKIITAIVALEHFDPDRILTVGNRYIEGQKMGLLPGERIKISDLLYGLLVYSANDAAETLADNYKGGRDVFISEMNSKASKIGLESTFFKNPTGLDEEGHVTTAEDLAKASEFAMKSEFIRVAVATKTKEVKSADGLIVHNLENVNELIGSVDGVFGVKTGWTENARENLITYVQREGRTISIVLLGSQDRFGETKELIEWIFENYDWESSRVSAG